jgi:cytochrome P450
MINLLNHPKVLEKARAEVANILNGRDDILFEDLGSLKYIECVIKESLRFQTTVPLLPKICVEDAVVNGYVIPKGITVMINLSALHHNPEYWVDADKFIPERWENGFTPVSGSYFPFGDGLTNCIGIYFGEINLHRSKTCND